MLPNKKDLIEVKSKKRITKLLFVVVKLLDLVVESFEVQSQLRNQTVSFPNKRNDECINRGILITFIK